MSPEITYLLLTISEKTGLNMQQIFPELVAHARMSALTHGLSMLGMAAGLACASRYAWRRRTQHNMLDIVAITALGMAGCLCGAAVTRLPDILHPQVVVLNQLFGKSK